MLPTKKEKGSPTPKNGGWNLVSGHRRRKPTGIEDMCQAHGASSPLGLTPGKISTARGALGVNNRKNGGSKGGTMEGNGLGDKLESEGGHQTLDKTDHEGVSRNSIGCNQRTGGNGTEEHGWGGVVRDEGEAKWRPAHGEIWPYEMTPGKVLKYRGTQGGERTEQHG